MKTIKVLQKLQRTTKAEVYLVGGYVRDLLRNKRNNDLDIVIKKLSLKDIAIFLRKYGKVKRVNLAQTNNVLLLFKSHGDYIEAQILLPKRSKKQISSINNTLKQDTKHRDFTLNAMYLPINYKSKKDVIDMVEGRQSIIKRKIFPVGKALDRIKESPIRILRAVSLAARMGYTIDNNIKKASHELKHLLYRVPIENIRNELNKILLSKKPSKYIRLLARIGVLETILPELDRCRKIKQDIKYHKYNVFTHCIYACDHIEPTLVLRLAALFHDIGKYNTIAITKDRITFHKHENKSNKLAKTILTRLKYDYKTKKEVLYLIKLHMYHYTREFTDAAVRRFIIRAKITENDLKDLSNFPLFKLRQADRLGSGFKHIPITKRQKDFEERIINTYKKSRGLVIKDLKINGNVLIKTFNLSPCVLIGQTLDFLLKCVLKKPSINNREDLLKLSAKYMYENIDRLNVD